MGLTMSVAKKARRPVSLNVKGQMDNSEHCKEVYAQYGLAMYLAQCVEQSLFQLIMMFDFFKDNVPKKLPIEKWRIEFESFEEIMSKKTLGQVIVHIKSLDDFDVEIEPLLKNTLKKRNRLAHRFFVDHGVNFVNREGRDKMIKELLECQDCFNESEETLVPIVSRLMNRYGFTDEMLKDAERELFGEIQDVL